MMNDASGAGVCYGAVPVLYCVLKEQAMKNDVTLASTRGDVVEAWAARFGNRS